MYNMIGWFPLFKGLRMKEKAYRLAGENEGRFNTGKLCRFCGTFIDFSSFNSQYQSKLMRQHLQEFHSHNATNPATRFFLLRTHKRRGCGTRLQRLYFLDKAYDMIQESATLRDTLLVTQNELQLGYIENVFLAVDNNPDDNSPETNVWVPGLNPNGGIWFGWQAKMVAYFLDWELLPKTFDRAYFGRDFDSLETEE